MSNKNLSYQDFLKKIKEAGIDYRTDNWYNRSYSYRNDAPKKAYISETWTTGGMTGGSCWGTDANYEVNGEPEPELTELDQIVELFIPDISFIRYKTKILPIIKRDSCIDREYYGNYYNKAIKIVFLEELYEVVIELSTV